eukprot:9408178-Karenia_brevis.AAC.1
MEAKDHKAAYDNSLCTMRRPLTLIHPQVRNGRSANGSRLSNRATSFLVLSKLITSLVCMRRAHDNNLLLSRYPWIGHL